MNFTLAYNLMKEGKTVWRLFFPESDVSTLKRILKLDFTHKQFLMKTHAGPWIETDLYYDDLEATDWALDIEGKLT